MSIADSKQPSNYTAGIIKLIMINVLNNMLESIHPGVVGCYRKLRIT